MFQSYVFKLPITGILHSYSGQGSKAVNFELADFVRIGSAVGGAGQYHLAVNK